MTVAATSPQSVRRVIIDTDPGIDDAMALLFLRARADVRIEAITTVFGNGGSDVTTRNAGFLAERFGIDAPIHAGADMPLRMPRRKLATHVHGADGLGDTGLADGFAGRAEGQPAHEAMIDRIRGNPGQISILALGPLTNLGLALEAAPDIASLVKEVVVMGGAFGFGPRRGNVSPAAEANIANDPHAADLVFGAAWPLTAVGLDVTLSCTLTREQAHLLAKHAGNVAKLLWDISRNYEELYRAHDGIDGCCMHDVAAAVRLVEPGLFETRDGPIRVVTEGIAIGQTIQKPVAQTFPPSAWDGVPAQSACVSVDGEQVVEIYMQAILDLSMER